MPQLRFHIYTFVGSWPWCFVLAYVGMKLGEQWHTDPRFQEGFHRFHLVVEIALVAAIVWFVWSHIKRVAANGRGCGLSSDSGQPREGVHCCVSDNTVSERAVNSRESKEG